MKYCVVKNTTTVIDGSENHQEVMLQNAKNAGFTETEVEILTKEEFEARKALEPVEPIPMTEEQQRITDLELAIAEILGGGL